jgi:hypothetical protein
MNIYDIGKQVIVKITDRPPGVRLASAIRLPTGAPPASTAKLKTRCCKTRWVLRRVDVPPDGTRPTV